MISNLFLSSSQTNSSQVQNQLINRLITSSIRPTPPRISNVYSLLAIQFTPPQLSDLPLPSSTPNKHFTHFSLTGLIIIFFYLAIQSTPPQLSDPLLPRSSTYNSLLNKQSTPPQLSDLLLPRSSTYSLLNKQSFPLQLSDLLFPTSPTYSFLAFRPTSPNLYTFISSSS